VLSKLRYYQHQPDRVDPAGNSAPDASLLAATLGEPSARPQAVGSGTLGAGFLLQQNGRRRFAKTNTLPEGRSTLEKEAAILTQIYGSLLHVERIETVDGGPRLWLVMDALSYPASPTDPKALLGLVTAYSAPLQAIEMSAVPAGDDFALLLQEGAHALEALTNAGHLTAAVGHWAGAQLALLGRELSNFPQVLCHGDLGPKNIMATSEGLVAIDWEDAFWGIEGYDYLYWLTFMDQRKHYGPSIFDRTPWGKDVDIAILALVILLKCQLSVLSGSVHDNRLSFDQRLQEIAALG